MISSIARTSNWFTVTEEKFHGVSMFVPQTKDVEEAHTHCVCGIIKVMVL